VVKEKENSGLKSKEGKITKRLNGMR
jgi:hypothetical protein